MSAACAAVLATPTAPSTSPISARGGGASRHRAARGSGGGGRASVLVGNALTPARVVRDTGPVASPSGGSLDLQR